MFSHNFLQKPALSLPPAIQADDDPPSINVQYVEELDSSQQQLDYNPPPFQADFLMAYRSGASDSGSECYSPDSSSPSSSPCLGGYSTDQNSSPSPSSSPFLGGHVHYNYLEPDNLAVDFNPYITNSMPYNAQHPSTHTHSYIPNDPPPVYIQYRHSMPDVSNITSDFHRTPFDSLTMAHQPLTRRASSSSLNPSVYSTDSVQDDAESSYAYDYPQDTTHPQIPSSPGPIMIDLDELIDGEQVFEIQELHNTVFQTNGDHQEHFVKSPKNTVATAAGKLASDRRRRHPGRFACIVKNCPSSFTRKLGLKNHIKSHLGIADQSCRYCHRLLPNSVSRHEKRCKQNPHRETPPKTRKSKKVSGYEQS